MTGSSAEVDTDRLESFLAERLPAAVTGIEPLSDKLNLLLSISTADEADAYVLRRPNKLRHASYIASLEREYAVLQGLRETPVDAPAPVLFCEDESIVGDAFFVMTHLGGETVPLGTDLPERFRDPSSRRRIAHGVIDALAGIHSVDAEPFADVCERLAPREQVARAVDRLDAATDVTGHERPTLWDVADWLRANAPTASETVLLHGDFRPGNLLFAGADEPTVAGVIDWETAMLGDPGSDLGYLLLRWRDEGDPRPSLEGIEARHSDDEAIREVRELNERGLSPFTPKPGSPGRRELVARYEEATGVPFEHERFYRAYAAFSLAMVWEDLDRHRVEAGAEPARGPIVEYMSLLASGIASGEFEL